MPAESDNLLVALSHVRDAPDDTPFLDLLARSGLDPKVDLVGTDLTGHDLSGGNLTNADLRETVFFEANLRGADFSFADLEGADLRGSDLVNARFVGSHLRNTLIDAYLYSSDASESVSEDQAQLGVQLNELERVFREAFLDSPHLYQKAVSEFLDGCLRIQSAVAESCFEQTSSMLRNSAVVMSASELWLPIHVAQDVQATFVEETTQHLKAAMMTLGEISTDNVSTLFTVWSDATQFVAECLTNEARAESKKRASTERASTGRTARQANKISR